MNDEDVDKILELLMKRAKRSLDKRSLDKMSNSASGEWSDTISGNHRHQCDNCFTVWSHLDVNIKNNTKAHTCPKCQNLSYNCYWVYEGHEQPTYLDWNGDK